jgi:hypothetical protein
MITPPGRQVLLFAAGGVSFALPLRSVREIAPADGGPGIDLAAMLGLRGEPRFALQLDAPGLRLLVGEMRGVADLAEGEVFRLPARSSGFRPSPFAGAVRIRGEVHLELAPDRLDASREPLAEGPRTVRDTPAAARELVAERGDLVLAVPLPLVVQVIEDARLVPVPLAPPGHRGLLYHGRAIHPVFDAAEVLGETGGGAPRVLLLLDAGGATAGILVDRVRGLAGAGEPPPARRPAWDVLLAPREVG